MSVISSLQWKGDHLLLLDQRQLPHQEIYLKQTAIEDVWNSISALVVRGAPAIGIAAAYGLVLWSQHVQTKDISTFKAELRTQGEYLASSRPTAVNLSWAIERIIRVSFTVPTVEKMKEAILKEAIIIHQEDELVCQRIGEHGLKLLNDGDTILTHCNAGGIATAKYGTALAPLHLAKQNGLSISAIATETRPVLQGARLTAWELERAGIDVTLITDSMAAHVLKTKKIAAVIVGADRIAANGDTANKIGTLGLAHIAKAYHVPFYIAAPLSTIDYSIPHGDAIPIEERDPKEITHYQGQRVAAENIEVFNPAFDVTPHHLINGIITEHGIIRTPYEENLVHLSLPNDQNTEVHS
ncbi:S-methyl-5-thioribose-1-phosphate isomerase [Bacillus sp. RAR_GA_16]|uniref:S-methyl-5-thioribose-1-phosphate isomerase n=1 Tax=Bacillus sp. RAR_GA_16 TaxID=2876774 RepID=UPI001CCDDA65|nr:S-methyl-5-thioribose-1-phosphate isomerase [Bacillus sp. RAR_GA_16]MCA0173304.1 S-methyl-5-thioribose-1-phosphate isomerase [Bacillus sp. RAR_GA_16]